jgi:hypothetical protein
MIHKKLLYYKVTYMWKFQVGPKAFILGKLYSFYTWFIDYFPKDTINNTYILNNKI